MSHFADEYPDDDYTADWEELPPMTAEEHARAYPRVIVNWRGRGLRAWIRRTVRCIRKQPALSQPITLSVPAATTIMGIEVFSLQEPELPGVFVDLPMQAFAQPGTYTITPNWTET